MNTPRLLFGALLALSAATAHAQSPAASTEQAGDAVADARLLGTVLLQLAADPGVDARNFDVEVSAGAITLVSRAATAAELTRAERVAQHAAGGATVRVQGARPDAAGETTDTPVDRSVSERYETYVTLGAHSDRVFEPVAARTEGSGTGTVARAASGDRPRTYTVQSGDNLSAIASRTMGDGLAWPRIFEMNRNVIGSNPDGLRAGMVLRIPQD